MQEWEVINQTKSEIEDIKNFYKSREEAIKFYNDCFKIVSKAACDSKHRKGLKILAIKQII